MDLTNKILGSQPWKMEAMEQCFNSWGDLSNKKMRDFTNQKMFVDGVKQLVFLQPFRCINMWWFSHVLTM